MGCIQHCADEDGIKWTFLTSQGAFGRVESVLWSVGDWGVRKLNEKVSERKIVGKFFLIEF